MHLSPQIVHFLGQLLSTVDDEFLLITLQIIFY